MTPECDVLVVGAGAAGLAAARTLEARGRRVVVVEARPQPGGVIRTSEIDGYRIEHGPNSFLVKPAAHRLLRELSLLPLLEKAQPESRKRQLFHAGRLVDVPMSPLAFVRTPLLSARAKRRLLAEPFVARGDGRSESVSDFISRRLGPEIASALAGPFLTGVYAGDEHQLGADAVFPALVELERDHGSLAIGGVSAALRARRQRDDAEQALPGTFSTQGGLGALAAGLASGLDVRLDTPVLALEPSAGGWRVALGEGQVEAKAVVLATPAAEAASLLEAVNPDSARSLREIAYAPIAAVAFGADPDALRSPAQGFGFLVPRDAKLGLLGCLFMSRLFAGRAPAGKLLLHCMVGGTRWPEALELDDAALTARVMSDLDATLGLRVEPQCLMIQRWPRAVAQPGISHRARVAELRRGLRDRRGLELTGSHLDGVSLADSLASGVAAAQRLLDAWS